MTKEEERVTKLREVFDLQAESLNMSTVELALTLCVHTMYFKLDHTVSTPCLDTMEMDCLLIASSGTEGISRVGDLVSGILDHSRCGSYCPLRNAVNKYDREENRVN